MESKQDAQNKHEQNKKINLFQNKKIHLYFYSIFFSQEKQE